MSDTPAAKGRSYADYVQEVECLLDAGLLRAKEHAIALHLLRRAWRIQYSWIIRDLATLRTVYGEHFDRHVQDIVEDLNGVPDAPHKWRGYQTPALRAAWRQRYPREQECFDQVYALWSRVRATPRPAPKYPNRADHVRNFSIWRDRELGMLLREVAAIHGVSVERVRNLHCIYGRKAAALLNSTTVARSKADLFAAMDSALRGCTLTFVPGDPCPRLSREEDGDALDVKSFPQAIAKSVCMV